MAEVKNYNIKLGSFKQLSLIDKNADQEAKTLISQRDAQLLF